MALGDVVSLLAADEVSPALGLVQALWQTEKGDKQVQVRAVARGSETVLTTPPPLTSCLSPPTS